MFNDPLVIVILVVVGLLVLIGIFWILSQLFSSPGTHDHSSSSNSRPDPIGQVNLSKKSIEGLKDSLRDTLKDTLRDSRLLADLRETAATRQQQAEILAEVRALKTKVDEIDRGLRHVAQASTSMNSPRPLAAPSTQWAPTPAAGDTYEPIVPPQPAQFQFPALPQPAQFQFPVPQSVGTRSPSEAVTSAYNSEPKSFTESFTVREFADSNMQARGRDHSLNAVYQFTEQGQGDFWLVVSGISQGLAVPKYRAVYTIGQFASGALNEVFQCREFQLGYRYRKLQLIKPARFRETSNGLDLSEPGELICLAPEPEV